MLLNTKKLLNKVRGLTEVTFLTKKAVFHPLKQIGCVNPWDVWMDDPGDFQNVSLLLHYIIIFIYIYYTYKYVSYTYFTVHVEVFVCFEIVTLTSGVSFFVLCAPVI